MAYVAYKYLPKRTAYDKVLSEKAFAVASNPKYGGYQCELASVVYIFFDKKSNDTAKDTATHTGTEIVLKINS